MSRGVGQKTKAGKMTVYDNTYSRFIAWAKVVLPLVALAILSTLFLFSRSIDPTQAIPYSQVDVEELAREQRIGEPNFAGVTQDGAAVSIVAKAARPDPQDSKQVTGTDLSATIDMPVGTRVQIAAPQGVIDAANQVAALSGGITLTTSTGYSVATQGLTTALDRTSVISDGAVTAEGPLGTLDAGQVVLTQHNGDDPAYVLVFKDGVKLVYDPKH